MDKLYIKHTEFNPDNLIKTNVESKQSKPRVDPSNPAAGAQSVPYQVMPIRYQYSVKREDGTSVPVIGPLSIEAPPLFSPSGIMIKSNSEGFDTGSIFTTFDMTDPDVRSFCSMGPEHTGDEPGFWQKLYVWCLDKVFEARPQIPSIMNRARDKASLAGLFGFPLYFKRDMATGDILPGSNPSRFFNLTSYGKVGSAGRKETTFQSSIVDRIIGGEKSYKSYSWNMLTNAEVKFQPVITFRQLYIGGGKVTLQFEITSAVVVSAVPAGSSCKQKDTISRYEQDPAHQALQSAQFEVLSRRLVDHTKDGTSSLPVVTSEVVVSSPAPAAPASSPERLPLERVLPLPTPSSGFGSIADLKPIASAAPSLAAVMARSNPVNP